MQVCQAVAASSRNSIASRSTSRGRSAASRSNRMSREPDRLKMAEHQNADADCDNAMQRKQSVVNLSTHHIAYGVSSSTLTMPMAMLSARWPDPPGSVQSRVAVIVMAGRFDPGVPGERENSERSSDQTNVGERGRPQWRRLRQVFACSRLKVANSVSRTA
jgi:hypothetical protein